MTSAARPRFPVVLTVLAVTVPAEYSVRGAPFPWEIAPGAAVAVEIDVTPTLPGARSGAVVVTTSAGNLTFPVVTTATPVNDAPTLSAVPDLTLIAGRTSGSVPLTVGDEDTELSALVLTLSSSDPTRLPSSDWIISGAGADRTLVITPPPGPSATVTLTASVSDGQAHTERDFQVRIIQDVVTVSLKEGGGIALRFSGLPGQAFRLQWSEDCATWHDGDAHVAGDDGQIEALVDPSPSAARYFRFRSVP